MTVQYLGKERHSQLHTAIQQKEAIQKAVGLINLWERMVRLESNDAIDVSAALAQR